jgi:hypothetical protein
MSPIAGFTRNRYHNFGKQSVLNTPVTATRRVAFRGVPDINPNWTEQEVDTGSIDPTVLPYRGQLDITMPLTGELNYHHIPLIMAASVQGGVTPSGGPAYTWQHTTSSLTATTLDYFTDQFGDDVTPAPEDTMELYGGIVERWTVGFDETLGPWQLASDWRFSGVNAHKTPTAGLQVGSNIPLVFGRDTALYIDDTAGGIGGTLIAESLHSAEIRYELTVDVKRFAAGSNTRWQVSGYGVSARVIGATFRFAKTSQIVAALNSETVDWLAGTPVTRFVRLVTESEAIITGSTPYSWTQSLGGTWRVRQDTEIGGNSVVDLQLVGRYDSVLGYAYRSTVVNALASTP